ncbi:helix-turn-helix domain-containing protein [Ciceribacter sp. L1K22]|nr:helix-turn-helix domain-containing protein [Ciceribacter sp. L1K22]
MDKFVPDASDDTLGGRLSSARDAVGVSLADLANQLGVRHETLQAWEADRAEPRPSRLVNLAGILGVSPMWLMTGQGDGPVHGGNGELSIEAMQTQLLRMRELHTESGRLLSSLQRQVDEMQRSTRRD